jgi:predicted nuclease of restriction endonuclease-like (RecB) superfamily
MMKGSVDVALPKGYAEWLADVKERVRATTFRAAQMANEEVLRLYWSVGRDILDRQERLGWGAKVVRQFSADMSAEFPGQKGWSRTNLLYMRRVAQVWPSEDEFVQQPVGRLPWGHILCLLDKLPDGQAREWYAARAVDEGWSRAVLQHEIAMDLRGRLGTAPSNFRQTLPPHDTDLAQQLVKDPYVFEHLSLVERRREQDVEQALMDRLQATLMEFGRGMAFVGRQVRFSVDGKDLHVDLLLFNIDQLRYVVVELKIGEFESSYLGQLGAYVAMVDDLLRRPQIHQPTVGILLCTSKASAIVKYALASTAVPVAVADYAGLPEDARAAVPPAEDLRVALSKELDSAK